MNQEVKTYNFNRLLKEILILILAGVLVTLLFTEFIYPLLKIPSHGPIPVRTLVFVIIITYFLRRLGRNWKEFGLTLPIKWWVLAIAVIVVFALKLLVLQPLGDWFRVAAQLPPNDYSFFEHIEGNIPALIIWMIIVWVVGGFAEEMVFRGYLMRALAESMNNNKLAWILGLVGQAIIFGVGHAYVGWGSAFSSFLTALLFGGVVLICKKSLWPAIIVHGVWDTLALLVFYLEGVPGG